MVTRPPVMAPLNETESSFSRLTREGKQITYKLSVMQQPERARACGAGAKSSADRRPVDPPPVVELRIFESDPANEAQMTDITFAYNANFFLYTTLDAARLVAQGRMTGPPSCPVLTGVPVAGVAYLDRPSQAGYFIFPDLSVRHEGRYRLSFHLYEELKDAKDADKDSTLPIPSQVPRPTSAKPTSPQAFLHFRLEVKSKPFTVYSAKKFPGLATSTSLSRIIAEQGCRVRIRRDVRMRRRGDKREGDFEYNEERAAGYRPDRYSTPDRYIAATVERPRSNSNSSNLGSPYAYRPELQRRPSGPDYGFQSAPQPYQRPMPPAPLGPAQPPAYPSHLSFGPPPSTYLPSHLPPTPPPAVPSSMPSMYSPHTSFSHLRHQSNPSDYDGTPAPYACPPPVPDRAAYGKNSLLSYSMDAPKGPPYVDARVGDPHPYQNLPQPALARAPAPRLTNSLPPLRTLSSEYTNAAPSVESTAPTSGYDALSGKRMLYQTEPKVGKRSRDESFAVDERPLQDGMRPDSETYSSTARKFEAERAALVSEFGSEMTYKRANGQTVMKYASQAH